jgi:hypothetical protein
MAFLEGQGYEGHKMVTRQRIANTTTYLVATSFSAAFRRGQSGISCSFRSELANRNTIRKARLRKMHVVCTVESMISARF